MAGIKPYGIFDKIKFGKYKGDTIAMILANDPGYLKWCNENIKGFRMEPVVEDQVYDR